MRPPVVIVLASGRGERFRASGGVGSKLRALLRDRSVLEWTLAAVRASGLPYHLEDAGHEGMGDSIAAGVRATYDASGWLILPGDLPLIQPASLQAVAQALTRQPVAVPVYQDQRGHPVGFAQDCRSALCALEGKTGAAPVVRAYTAMNCVATIELSDVGIVADVDTVDDLGRALRLLEGR